MKVEKKTWPEEFQAVLDGRKKFDLRLADFDIQEGDILVLKEYNPGTKEYTGRFLEKKVTYLLKTPDLKFWPEDEMKRCGFQVVSLE